MTSPTTAERTAIEATINSMLANTNSTDAPNIDYLTTAVVEGSGVFDKLMTAGLAHIKAEYDANRIRGTDYATAYLGIIQSSMQNAVNFAVAWDKASLEKAVLAANLANVLKQNDLLEAQIVSAGYQDILVQAETEVANAKVISAGIGDQLTEAQTDLVNTQITSAGISDLLTRAQTSLVDTQIASAVLTDALTSAKTELTEAQTVSAAISDLLVESQTELADTQVVSAAIQDTLTTSQTELVEAQTVSAEINDTLTKSQSALYIQKVVTELAEVCTDVPNTIAAGRDILDAVPYAPNKIAGSKGAARDVSLEQRAGYMRKAQNDLIKVATGHVDMLVSSGAATDVGTYTTNLLQLLQTGSSTGYFTESSLLAKAVTDAASLAPSDADSQ